MIKTQPIYDPLYTDKEKFIYLVTGGRGSGKSFNVSTFLSRLSFTAGHKILFSRYTMSSAKDSVIPEFNEKIELDGFEEYFKVNVNDIKNTFSGSEIIFRGIKAGSGNQTAKLKSLTNLTVFVVDEGEEWASEEEFEKIMLSIRGKGVHNRVIIIMNPSDENHFVYRKYIKNTHKIVDYDGAKVQISTHPDVLHIHTSYLDNLDNLSEEFIAIAQRTKETNRKKYDRVFMGRWADVSEGAIFKNYEVIDKMPSCVDNLVIGIDYGYTNDPTACTLVGIEGDNLYLKELFYLKGMKTREIAERLKEYNLKVISESADPRIIDEIAEYGIHIVPVNKGDVNGVGSIKAGINKMLEMNIHITKDSLNILEEFKKYSWEKDKDGQLTTRPIDGYNHCFVGNTLISTIDGLKPIKDTNVGDYVLTRNGYKRVLKKFDNGVKDVVNYTINGVNLTATPSHKIKTLEGWKEMRELSIGDVITKDVNYRSLMENYTSSIRTKDIYQEGQEGFTSLFGSFIMVKLKMVTRFITKILIRLITILRTLKNYLLRSTQKFTRMLSRVLNLRKEEGSTWTPLDTLRKNGTHQKKGESGILNTVKEYTKTEKKRSLSAKCAERSIAHTSVRTINFAQTTANRNGEGLAELTTSKESARCAGIHSLSTNTQKQNIAQEVVAELQVQPKGSDRVYDLMIENKHEYFANGMLVHNCIDGIRYCVLMEVMKVGSGNSGQGVFY